MPCPCAGSADVLQQPVGRVAHKPPSWVSHLRLSHHLTRSCPSAGKLFISWKGVCGSY